MSYCSVHSWIPKSFSFSPVTHSRIKYFFFFIGKAMLITTVVLFFAVVATVSIGPHFPHQCNC